MGVNVGVGTFKLTYEVTVNDKKYEEIVEVRVEESPILKGAMVELKERKVELEEGEEYTISLNKVEGSAIEYVKVTLVEGGKAHIKGEEGKREREYLKGDQKQEDVVIVMEGKVEEEKLKIEVKIEGEEKTRELAEGAIL